MGMSSANRQAAVASIRAREPFAAGTNAMHGAPGGRLVYGHQLPEPYASQYATARSAGLVAYTVYSYATPIAWILQAGTVIIPEVVYSVTTSAHQSIARQALDAA